MIRPTSYSDALQILKLLSKYKSANNYADCKNMPKRTISRYVNEAKKIISDCVTESHDGVLTDSVGMPRLCFWDIETSKIDVAFSTYSLGDMPSYLKPKYITRDWWVISAAWRFMGDNTVYNVSTLQNSGDFSNNYDNDFRVVKVIAEVLNNCDIVVAHNGDNFDWKKIYAKCLKYGFTPKKPLMIDTLKIARKEFKLTSNKLSFLADYLEIENKDDAPNWDAVQKGCKESTEYCVQYNKQDVKVLEDVYLKLRPYIKNHPNMNHFTSKENICPNCGSDDIMIAGSAYTRTTEKLQYKCNACGAFSTGETINTVTIK